MALEAWDTRLLEMLDRGRSSAEVQQAGDSDQPPCRDRLHEISIVGWRTMFADPQVEIETDQPRMLTNVNI